MKMKKKYLGIILLFVFFNSAKSQNCENINCSDIKEFVTTRITHAYLIDLVKVKSGNNVKEMISYSKIEADLNSNNLETPLNFNQLLKDLNENGFSKVADNFAKPIYGVKLSINPNINKELLATEILNQLLGALTKERKDNINKIPDLVNSITSQLNSYILKKLQNFPKSDTNEESYEKTNLKAEKKSTTITDAESVSLFSNSFLFLIFYIIALICIMLLYLRINKVEKSVNNKLQNLKNEKEFQVNMRGNQNAKVELRRPEFEILLESSEKFNTVRNNLIILENNLKELNTNNFSISNATGEVVNPEVINQGEDEIFYMASPVGNSFPVSTKSQSQSQTVYKFFVGKNKNFAEYEIHTQGPPISEIIKRSESYLVPGCNEENNPSDSTNRITTTLKGQVQLEGDKWVIIRKALIKYE